MLVKQITRPEHYTELPHQIWSHYWVQQGSFITIGHALNKSNQRKSQDRGVMYLLHGCFIIA